MEGGRQSESFTLFAGVARQEGAEWPFNKWRARRRATRASLSHAPRKESNKWPPAGLSRRTHARVCVCEPTCACACATWPSAPVSSEGERRLEVVGSVRFQVQALAVGAPKINTIIDHWTAPKRDKARSSAWSSGKSNISRRSSSGLI